MGIGSSCSRLGDALHCWLGSTAAGNNPRRPTPRPSPASIMAGRSWGHSRNVRRRCLPAMRVMGPFTSRTSCRV